MDTKKARIKEGIKDKKTEPPNLTTKRLFKKKMFLDYSSGNSINNSDNLR